MTTALDRIKDDLDEPGVAWVEVRKADLALLVALADACARKDDDADPKGMCQCWEHSGCAAALAALRTEQP